MLIKSHSLFCVSPYKVNYHTSETHTPTSSNSASKMPANKVFIARHGERIDHVDQSWIATADRPHDPYLTPRGVAQAVALANRLAAENITCIYASPFYRTVETAAQVAKVVNAPVKIEHGICEFLASDWFPTAPDFLPPCEMPFEQVDSSYQTAVRVTYPETRATFIRRAADTAKRLGATSDGNILLVAHGISCEFTARGLTGVGVRPFIPYCGLQTVVIENGKWMMARNDVEVEFMPIDIRSQVESKDYR